MSEEVAYIPDPPETFEPVPKEKNKKTLWIILAIVAVVLLCCCLIIVLIAAFSFSADDYSELFYQLLPYLNLA